MMGPFTLLLRSLIQGKCFQSTLLCAFFKLHIWISGCKIKFLCKINTSVLRRVPCRVCLYSVDLFVLITFYLLFFFIKFGFELHCWVNLKFLHISNDLIS